MQPNVVLTDAIAREQRHFRSALEHGRHLLHGWAFHALKGDGALVVGRALD